MDYRRLKAPTTTQTLDMNKLSEEVGNVYETVAIIAMRANQISVDLKKELEDKLQEFATSNDNIEEVFENKEQIEVSRYYEKLPKPVLLATKEFINHQIFYRNPVKEKENLK